MIPPPRHYLLRYKRRKSVRRKASLTLCQGVVDAETAQDLIDIAGVEKPVSPHHHLERL